MNLYNLPKSARVELNNLRLELTNNSKFISTEKEETIVNSIQKNGYCILDGFFSNQWCEKAKDEIDHLILKYKDQIWMDETESDHRLFGADRVSDLIRDYYKNSVIIPILQTYEGAEVQDGFTLGARLEYSQGNMGSGGGWHRDHPNVKQSKSIVYLSDVSGVNGPFQYIKSSHTTKSVYRDSYKYKFDQFQNRFTDKEIQRIIDEEPERLVTFTGSAGTVILTDTRGIHRGKPIEKGVRYALTNYLWMHSNIPKHIKETLIF
jgi:hypothetical protein